MAKLSADEAIAALRKANGNISIAARNTGVTRQTMHNYINDHATVKAALNESRETMIDFAEGKLFEQINTGNMTAIIFFLKTQGKSRGYVERHEHTGEDGKDLQIILKTGMNLDDI